MDPIATTLSLSLLFGGILSSKDEFERLELEVKMLKKNLTIKKK
jgi:hypothetical protein